MLFIKMKKAVIVAVTFMTVLIFVSCTKNDVTMNNENETTSATIEASEESQNVEAVDYSNLHIEDNGNTCYVEDYAGGMLDVKKYGKFKKLVFSENKIKNIESMESMFSPYKIIGYGDDSLDYSEGGTECKVEEIDFTGLDTSKVTSMKGMFNKNPYIKKINFGDIDTSNVTDMYKMFCECKNLEEITFGKNFTTKNVKNMRGMFFYCNNLKRLDLTCFDTSNCEEMGYMFYRCQNIESLDVSKFDTSKCTNMEYMFGNMRNLKNIDMRSFNTATCSNMQYMFYRNHELEKLDLSSFDTSNVRNMSFMFYCCYKLKEINATSFDTSNVGNFDYMFYFCEGLKNLDLKNFTIKDISDSEYEHLVSVNYMFRYCDNLEHLDMSNFNFSKSYGEYVFDGNQKLLDFKYDTNKLFKLDKAKGDEKMHVAMETERLSVTQSIEDLKKNDILKDYADRRNSISNKDIMFMNADGWVKLLQNEFVVKKEAEYKEFFNYYEETRYDHFPNYVTADSILHTYHLYFDYLMKSIEKNNLYDKIESLTKICVRDAEDMYNKCKGTSYEKNAKAVLAYFSVPELIFDNSFTVNADVKDIVEKTYNNIMDHSGIKMDDVFLELYDPSGIERDPNYNSYFAEDFSQYKPRGHYDGDTRLENYFRVFMWYGRIGFTSEIDDFNKCAILVNLIFDNETNLKNYNDIKNTIYYFAGTSDDVGYEEYIKCIIDIFGSKNVEDIIKSDDKLANFKKAVKNLRESKINSSPEVYELNVNNRDHIVSFRLIGQTYTYDEEIFKNLIFDYVAKTDDNEKRYLPDFLDVPATFYSDTALNILKENGDYKYPNFEKQLDKMRKTMPEKLKNDTSDVLYVKWLKCLLSIIDTENNTISLPSYMKNDEHKKKSLETFGGSYAELKHDTILYTKQTYGVAECGEGGEPEFYDEEDDVVDNKGYVEPQKELYLNLFDMADSMDKTFSNYGMLKDTDSQFLNNFSSLAKKLAIIADKELNGEKLTLEEYELIEGYGATIEHLIIESGAYDEYDEGNPQKSTAIVADIATGELGGNYLAREIATGNPIRIYVLVEVDGVYKVCQGAAYDFYQFEVKADDRMTDIEWRTKMKFDDGMFEAGYEGSTSAWDNEVYNEETGEWEYTNNTYKPKNNDDLTFQTWTNSYKHSGTAYSYRLNYCTPHHCGGYVKINICGFTNT